MIFFTLGTERFPFNRLVTAAEQTFRALQEPVKIQTGDHSQAPVSCEWIRYMPYPEFIDCLKRARIVVSHGGVGTLLSCIRLGKMPIVLPRRRHFGEHLDDHQVEFSEKMAAVGRVLLAEKQEDILRLIRLYDEKCAACPVANPSSRLTDALLDYLRNL